MKWNEMKWNEMKWNDMKWYEIQCVCGFNQMIQSRRAKGLNLGSNPWASIAWVIRRFWVINDMCGFCQMIQYKVQVRLSPVLNCYPCYSWVIRATRWWTMFTHCHAWKCNCHKIHHSTLRGLRWLWVNAPGSLVKHQRGNDMKENNVCLTHQGLEGDPTKGLHEIKYLTRIPLKS